MLNLLFAGWYGFPLFLFAPLSAHAHDRTHSVFVGSSKQVIKGVCVCVDKGTKSRTIAHTAAPLFSFKGHCERVRECVYFAHKGSSPDLHECVCKKAKSCVRLLLKALNSLFALLTVPLSALSQLTKRDSHTEISILSAIQSQEACLSCCWAWEIHEWLTTATWKLRSLIFNTVVNMCSQATGS